MYEKSINGVFFEEAKKYLKSISEEEQGAIGRDIEELCHGKSDNVYTKQLHGRIREIISGNHRIIYFQMATIIYFVSGFRKKKHKNARARD
ncbi:MAG: type II toxin-antitoxin system RelE/ParE family toxin [bacterium]|nr:type II toxin-antitoxin system RelE/ParE family toxin [bacterium]